MENQIVICGWNVTIKEEHKIIQTDADGFKFSKIFCIGEHGWNKRPVYFVLAGSTRALLKPLPTRAALRKEYGGHLADGWAKA